MYIIPIPYKKDGISFCLLFKSFGLLMEGELRININNKNKCNILDDFSIIYRKHQKPVPVIGITL